MTQFRNFDAPARPQRVTITWRMETPQDDSGDTPEERDDAFWPARDDYESEALFQVYQEQAELRMAAWRRDEWSYVGVVAVAHVAVPIGGASFVMHEFRSAGLWGIESDSGDYLREVFEEERRELKRQLQELGAALQSGEYDEEDAE